MFTLTNPITVKELRSRMRGVRAILPIMAYLVVLSIFILVAFGDFRGSWGFSDLSVKGRQLGFNLMRTQLFLVLVLAPAYAASAIAIEKERETFGTMQITLLTPLEIVSGKVLSGVSYVALLMVSSLPLLSLIFWMGGFSFTHLIWGFVIIVTCALVTTCTGIFISTIYKKSHMATGMTYTIVIAGIALGYAMIPLIGIWRQAQQLGTSSFAIDTVPVWLAYSLNPFYMLNTLDTGSVNYTGFSGYYNNPMIDFFDKWLGVMHVPYAGLFIVLSFALSGLFLVLAGFFLFRRSREDNP